MPKVLRSNQVPIDVSRIKGNIRGNCRLPEELKLELLDWYEKLSKRGRETMKSHGISRYEVVLKTRQLDFYPYRIIQTSTKRQAERTHDKALRKMQQSQYTLHLISEIEKRLEFED
ncbi:MAG: hypothetical protein KJ718_02780 [Nanoarchaeota archaeon]|nr:hypothetical protein [Nanoarchaeota archaeon]MBU1051455.1 hypothetical protein [Nanoarchaeota archaeon]MBU1989014.1 hypothetical protein [Nanoarchaeota archaeon]